MKLGMGLQRILLGLGAKKEEVSKYIIALNINDYLMIFGGSLEEFQGIDIVLESIV